MLAALRRHFDLTAGPGAARFGARGAVAGRRRSGAATVGIIASVSHAFCSACDRTRLTADGQVRNCLFARRGDRPAAPACAPAPTTTRVEAAWRAAMWAKAAGPRHQRPGLRAAGPPDERDRRLTGHDATATTQVTVRYFAAARAAAGIETRSIRRRAGHDGRRRWSTRLGERDAELAKVLQRCSFLCDGIAVRDSSDDAGRRVRQSMFFRPFAGG